MNPDWEDAFEKSGLGDKLREMNELQLEGADAVSYTHLGSCILGFLCASLVKTPYKPPVKREPISLDRFIRCV